MDRIELAACAGDLIALAGRIRGSAHGRADALELHDIARTLEKSADRLVVMDQIEKPRTMPST